MNWKSAAPCALASLFCASCVNLYGALLAPKHPKIALVSVSIVGDRDFERIPGPFIKIVFTSKTDLAEMARSRYLNMEVHIYRCESADDEPPDAFDPSVVAYDVYLRDQSDAIVNFEPAPTAQPTEYNAYVNVRWPWPPSAPHYDLSDRPDNLCVRAEGGTGLEMGNLIPYRISSNALFIPADRIKQAIAQQR